MDALELKILGDEVLQKKLDELAAKMPGEMMKLGMASGIAVERELRLAYSEGPLHARSNRAERSVTAFVERRGDTVVSGAGSPVFYLPVHEHGAVIVPREAEALVFQLEDGTWIATHRVVIPARKPGQHAAEQAEPTVRKIYSDGINRFIGR